jgi:hypothetical protein
MSSFHEANQAKHALKMSLSHYCWFMGISAITEQDGYCVLVHVSHMDNAIRKVVPIVHNNVSIKVDIETKKRK